MAIALALTTSLLYGIAQYIGPVLSRTQPLFVVMLTGQSVALVAATALALATGEDFIDGSHAAAGLAAGVGNAAGLLCSYRAAQLGPLSLITPIFALGAVVPVTVGLASGDSAGALKLAGIAIALSGVALAARRPGGTPKEVDRAAAIRWALGSCVGFGAFLSFLAPASEDGILWAVAFSRLSLVTTGVVVGLALGQVLRVPGRDLPRLAVPGVLLFSGTLAYAAATREGDLSVVSVLGSLFPVVTVAMAFAIGGERLTRVQAFGVVAALLGVVLVSAR